MRHAVECRLKKNGENGENGARASLVQKNFIYPFHCDVSNTRGTPKVSGEHFLKNNSMALRSESFRLKL